MIDVAILEKEILRLNFQERSRLASALVRSLDDSKDELNPAEWEQLWIKECERRIAEMDSGENEGIPWEDVLAEARELVK